MRVNEKMALSFVMKCIIALAFIVGVMMVTIASVAVHLAGSDHPSDTYKSFVNVFGALSILVGIVSLVPASVYVVSLWKGEAA